MYHSRTPAERMATLQYLVNGYIGCRVKLRKGTRASVTHTECGVPADHCIDDLWNVSFSPLCTISDELQQKTTDYAGIKRRWE